MDKSGCSSSVHYSEVPLYIIYDNFLSCHLLSYPLLCLPPPCCSPSGPCPAGDARGDQEHQAAVGRDQAAGVQHQSQAVTRHRGVYVDVWARADMGSLRGTL